MSSVMFKNKRSRSKSLPVLPKVVAYSIYLASFEIDLLILTYKGISYLIFIREVMSPRK